MPFVPTGTWSIDANGSHATLTIAVDAEGRVTGAYGRNAISGLWDDASLRITFVRPLQPNDPSTYQIFTGYLWFEALAIPNGILHMGGSFETFGGGGGGDAKRSTFGWVAWQNPSRTIEL
jgi:hypothetical protein